MNPSPEVIREAAAMICEGKLVAFPTETVYGLGADALSETAVRSIFSAKGRPSFNPVIVHVDSIAAARELAAEWTEVAQRLAEAFWPGPLTLVVKRGPAIPDAVTAGGPTVAIRMPSHPVALALLREAGPIAAPSANRSEEVSPTRAEHVLKSLDGMIDGLLDAGPTQVGLESTVVDVSQTPLRILRPGMLIADELRKAAPFLVDCRNGERDEDESPFRSPGQMLRHYAPRAPLFIAPREAILELFAVGNAQVLDVQQPQPTTATLGWIDMAPDVDAASTRDVSQHNVSAAATHVHRIELSGNSAGYARELYHALHTLDNSGVQAIYATAPPTTSAWQAIWDRLSRAAQKV